MPGENLIEAGGHDCSIAAYCNEFAIVTMTPYNLHKMKATVSNQTAITNALSRVQSFDSMTPSPEFNDAVNELVNTIITLPEEDLPLVTPELRKTVQILISDVESHREAEWAKRIAASDDPVAELHAFPYRENYNRIVSREIDLLDESGLRLDSRHRMLAIGSGPLPMTALQFHERRGVVVDQSDIDTTALELGQRVSDALSAPGKYILGAGDRLCLEDQYDVIFVAVLAGGSHEEKQAIVSHLLPCLKPHGRFLLRSAKGARSIIYPTVEADKLTEVRLLGEVHPDDIVINSSLVFERKTT